MSLERLERYNFDSDVLDRAAAVEDAQRSYNTDFIKYLGDHGIGIDDLRRTPDMIDIKSGDRDDKKALIVHQPIGNPLKAHRLVGVVSLANMFPDRRVISFSNPGHIGSRHKRSSLIGAASIAGGTTSQYLDDVEHYVIDEGIEHVDHVGESLGGYLATEAGAKTGYKSGMVAAHDPSSTVKTSFMDMNRAFEASNARFKEYLNSGQELSAAAFEVAGDGDTFIYGLMRATNLAFARMVRLGNYEDTAERALKNGTDVTLFHGGDSSICLPNRVRSIIGSLQAQDFGTDAGRIQGIELLGDGHAYPNDLGLMNAATAQVII